MENFDIKNKEKALGRKAAKMAQEHLHAVIRQNLRVRGKGESKSLLKATKVLSKMGDHRLLGLNLTSSKVGFIQHYGFTGVRDATTVIYQHRRFKINASRRNSHQFQLKDQNFFEDFFFQSGAVDFLLAGLRETRTEAVINQISDAILRLNKIEDNE